MYKRLLAWLFAAGLNVLANPARADGADGRSSAAATSHVSARAPEGALGRWGVGLSVGYAVPQGKMFGLQDLNASVNGVLKPQLELSYGMSANLVLGLHFALGGGFQPNERSREACDSLTCQILLLESGLSAEYRILPHARLNPWVSVNLGLERFTSSYKSDWGSSTASIAMLGVGFGAALGADAQLGDVGIGPFFAFQVGRYMSSKARVDDDRSNGSIDKDDRAYHYWLNFGVRVRYQFRP